MASEETAQPSISAPATASGGGKLVTILTLVNLIATLAMVAVLYITFQQDKKKPAVEDIVTRSEAAAPAGAKKGEGEEAKKGEGGEGAAANGAAEFGKMVTLDQFTVNLSTPGSVNPKFVRVNVSLQVPSTDVENEVNAKMPQVRNAIIDLFNSKRPADLANAEGRDYLKEEIKNAINGFMVNGKIEVVFFTNFAVSS